MEPLQSPRELFLGSTAPQWLAKSFYALYRDIPPTPPLATIWLLGTLLSPKQAKKQP